MPELLRVDVIDRFCADHPDWHVVEGVLVRATTAATFPAAIALVDAVAQTAEEMDHHPDIDIRWRTVTFRLSTHSAGGLTPLDLDLARRIDGLVVTQD